MIKICEICGAETIGSPLDKRFKKRLVIMQAFSIYVNTLKLLTIKIIYVILPANDEVQHEQTNKCSFLKLRMNGDNSCIFIGWLKP